MLCQRFFKCNISYQKHNDEHIKSYSYHRDSKFHISSFYIVESRMSKFVYVYTSHYKNIFLLFYFDTMSNVEQINQGCFQCFITKICSTLIQSFLCKV